MTKEENILLMIASLYKELEALRNKVCDENEKSTDNIFRHCTVLVAGAYENAMVGIGKIMVAMEEYAQTIQGYSEQQMRDCFDAGYKHGWGQSEFEGESLTPNKEKYLSTLPPQPAQQNSAGVWDILGNNNAFSLVEILERLSGAVKFLLDKRNYDGPDYEELEHCVKAAKETIQLIAKQPPAQVRELPSVWLKYPENKP